MTALDDLVHALRTAQTSVFRLEAGQQYPDDELWQAHLRGECWQRSEDLAWWCSLVAANRRRGVAMTRVRAVTEPWTPYTRWEIEEHYPHNTRAGEDVRLMPGGAEPHDDFWLVDSEQAWWLRYDESGSMTVLAATAGAIPSLLAVRDRALAAADPASPVVT